MEVFITAALVTIITILLFIGIIIYGAFAWGYVAYIIYDWFILSQFTELPVIYWWQFAGIMFFVNCFVHSTDLSYFKDEIKDTKKGLFNSLARPWMVLIGAWLFKIIIL